MRSTGLISLHQLRMQEEQEEQTIIRLIINVKLLQLLLRFTQNLILNFH